MLKLKTNKSLTKRVRWTSKGKLKRTQANKGHLLTGKPRKRKRSLRKPALVSRADLKTMRRMLPYG